ncbi:YiaA/YiaB family inner membrane protein [Phormidesmis sp. 146-12]
MQKYNVDRDAPTSAWVVQVWASFVLSVSATTVGILNLPVDNWVKGYINSPDKIRQR